MIQKTHYIVTQLRSAMDKLLKNSQNLEKVLIILLPEGIESVHPRYAISWRNNWMLRQSDYVVTYITHSWGGAAQFAENAKKQKKVVVNLIE